MIKYIFALAMRFCISGHRASQLAIVSIYQDRQRLPATAFADASGFFERRQKRVGQKRIAVSGTRIPLRGINPGDALFNARGHLRHRVAGIGFS
jgi:hypothetical protein